MREVILVKYSEIGLKGKNRAGFEKQLADTIAATSEIRSGHVQRVHGRIVVLSLGEEERKQVQKALTQVFGVHAFTPAYKTERSFTAITEAAIALLNGEDTDNKTFGIETKRAAKDFELTSQQLNEKLGGEVLNEFQGLSVNLTNPDYRVVVEIHKVHAYIYLHTHECVGPGGLPVGVSGRGLLSLSGGIDSPVAGWFALKRGMPIDAVHFESIPFTGKKAQEKVFDLAQVLSQWKGAPVTVYMPSFADVQKQIADNAPEEYLTVLFRRSMQRIIARIAEAGGYSALITGENLGQVASQTLENMAAIERAAELLTLRPLVGFDKAETIEYAKNIGTYDISIRPYEDCCTVFTPRAPKTRTRAADCTALEEKLNLRALEETASQTARVYSVDNRGVTEARDS